MGVKRTKKKSHRKPALISFDSLDNTDNGIKYIDAEIIPEYIKKTLHYEGVSVLQVNIKYPQIKLKSNAEDIQEKATKRINKFYDNATKYFMKFSERVLYKNAVSEYINSTKTADNSKNAVFEPMQFKPFGAVLNFEVTYNKNNILCIYSDANIYIGKGRGNIRRKAYIWDLSSGIILMSERFIDFNGGTKNKICSKICGIIKEQTEKGEEQYIKTDFKTVYKYFNKRNMFITERGYNFFFPQSSLSPDECGIVSFLYVFR